MQFMVLIYNDAELYAALGPAEEESMMRGCIEHADELRAEGKLLDSQQLQPVGKAKTVRVRNGRTSVVDGPFAETKEFLGGFNLIEAVDMNEAVRIASEFPWASTGAIEVRPVQDFAQTRERVNAKPRAA